eukprot:13142566-Alexandrium_andersonii.AAC.1
MARTRRPSTPASVATTGAVTRPLLGAGCPARTSASEPSARACSPRPPLRLHSDSSHRVPRREERVAGR